MAVVFWLPKVIIVLTFCRISCSKSDELLYRVRLSKSDDPEIKDFLNSVLKHQDVLNWDHEVDDKQQYASVDDMLPLNGLPLKSKRSFYSSRNYPNYNKRSLYGYRRIEDPSNLYVDQKTPMNDVYPYNGERNMNAGRFYREVPHKRIFRDDDFLDEEEPDASEAKFVSDDDHLEESHSSGDYDHFEYDLQQVPHSSLRKRSTQAEIMSEENMELKKILRNSGNNYEKYKDNDNANQQYLRNIRSLEMSKDTNLENDIESADAEIDVEPRSQKGVLFAPGHKYEFKTNDYKKRCASDHDEHDIFENVEPKNNNSASAEGQMSEFYYTSTHDVLGINQDMALENRENNTVEAGGSCIAPGKSGGAEVKGAKLENPGNGNAQKAPIKRSSVKGKTNKKSIKIKIFDDGKLIKNVQQGDGSNSLILTIKNDKKEQPTPTVEPDVKAETNSNHIVVNNNSKLRPFLSSKGYETYAEKLEKDDTLQKIDTIISHDQDALKLNSQLPMIYRAKQDNDDIFSLDNNPLDSKVNSFNSDELPHIDNISTIQRKSISNYDGEDKYTLFLEPKKDYLTGKLQESSTTMRSVGSTKKYERLDEIGTSIPDVNPYVTHKPTKLYAGRPQSNVDFSNKQLTPLSDQINKHGSQQLEIYYKEPDINSDTISKPEMNDNLIDSEIQNSERNQKSIQSTSLENTDTEGSYEYRAMPVNFVNKKYTAEDDQKDEDDDIIYRKQLRNANNRRLKHKLVNGNDELLELNVPKKNKIYNKKINNAASEITDTSSSGGPDEDVPVFSKAPEKKNRLEDQTEPTSAAEQRELGKIGNDFKSRTPSMDMVTTEKMVIIPFKKKSEKITMDYADEEAAAIELADDAEFEKRPNTKSKFKVKDSKDMIHRDTNYVSKHSPSELKESIVSSNNVIDRLKSDLQKAIQSDNTARRFTDNKGVSTYGSSTAGEDIEYIADSDHSTAKSKKKDVEHSTYESTGEEYMQNSDQKREAIKEYDDEINLSPNKELTSNEMYFQSRNLKSMDEYGEEPISNYNLNDKSKVVVKRSLPDFFGMSNDQDYSEDREDYAMPKLKRSEYEEEELLPANKKKYETQTKGKVNEHKPIVHTQLQIKKNQPIILSKRSYFKNPLLEYKNYLKTSSKNRKEKKEIHHSTPQKNEKKLNIFTKNFDIIEKRDDTNYKVIKVRHRKGAHSIMKDTHQSEKNSDQSVTTPGSTSSTVCETTQDQEMSDESSDSPETTTAVTFEDNPESGDEQQQLQQQQGDDNQGGNNNSGGEMDILSKTQAILMRVTGIPGENQGEGGGDKASSSTSSSSCSNSKGEMDESEDGSSKISNNNNKKNTKHHADVDLLGSGGRNEDILNDILRLVNSYKENMKKKKARKTIVNSNKRFDENILDPSDVSFAHHLHKDKKLHPSSNQMDCKIKPNNNEHLVSDHYSKAFHPKHVEQEFDYAVPKFVRQGYAHVETVAEKRRKALQREVEDEPSSGEETEIEIYPIIKRVLRNNQNPLKFTPDSIESFKNIVENDKSLVDSDEDMYRYKRYLKHLYNNNDNFKHRQRAIQKNAAASKKVKREIIEDEDDALYNAVMDPLNNVEDNDSNIRLRRYKQYYPSGYSYYPNSNMPQIRQAVPPANADAPAPPAAPPTNEKNPAADEGQSAGKDKEMNKQPDSGANSTAPASKSNGTSTGQNETCVNGNIVDEQHAQRVGDNGKAEGNDQKGGNKTENKEGSSKDEDRKNGDKKEGDKKESEAKEGGGGKDMGGADSCDEKHHKGKGDSDEDDEVRVKDKKKKKGKHGHDEADKHDKGGNTKSHHNSEDAGDNTYDVRQHGKNGESVEHDRKLKDKDLSKKKNKVARDRLKEREHMKTVLSGHMALNIIESLHTRLKENEQLFNRFGQAIGRKCAQDQVAEIDKFREEQSKKDIKHAQLMLHQVIVMLNKIVADQVHRRTCLVLAPNLLEFLTKTLKAAAHANTKPLQISEGYPLPQIKEKPAGGVDSQIRADEKQGDFLFASGGGGGKGGAESSAEEPDDNTVKKKINLIKKLLNKYKHMSENCQIKVEPVKDYLDEHLKMLEKMDKEKKVGIEDNCTIHPDYIKKCDNGTTSANDTAKSETGDITTTTLGDAAGTSPASAKSVESLENQPAVTRSAHNYRGENKYPIERSSNDNNYRRSNARSYYNDASKFKNKNMNNMDMEYQGEFDKKGFSYSDKYKKLVDAADTYRRKREIEERLGRLFGKHKPVIKSERSNDVQDISHVAFEAPIVYSLE